VPAVGHLRLASALLVLAWVAAASPALAEAIRVGVAISLKEAATEIGAAYESASGDTVEFVFGSSGQVAGQIKNGAEIDAFLSAATRQVDDLANEGLVDGAARTAVASNALALIVPAGAKDAPASFAALADANGKVAVGEPKTVPAGQYAGQVLKSLKLADRLAGRLVFGTNVRQVLAYVERGEVAAGIVYATDAREAGAKVRVVATADPATHEPIVYPAVVVTASKRRAAAERFLAHLQSREARKVLRARGFIVPADDAKPGGGGGGEPQ
jgi:molybdate transport system substrate-binding protein